jgi:hypothetical protein
MSEEKRKEKLWKCPVCGNSGKLSSRRKQGLQFYKSRCCQVCNTIWNPGFDRLSAFITILVGFIIVAIFIIPASKAKEVMIDLPPFDDYRGGDLCAFLAVLGFIIGLSLIVYGIAVFVGMAGKATIIQQGTKIGLLPLIFLLAGILLCVVAIALLHYINLT